MNITSIVNYILIAGAIQGFGFNLVTLFLRRKISKPIVFLNLVVFFISINNLQRFLIDINFFDFSFFLNQLQIPWYFLSTPMFYAFTVHFLGLEKKVSDFVRLSVFIFITEIILRLILISYLHYEVPNRDTLSIVRTYTSIEELLDALSGLFLCIRVYFFVYGERYRNNNV